MVCVVFTNSFQNRLDVERNINERVVPLPCRGVDTLWTIASVPKVNWVYIDTTVVLEKLFRHCVGGHTRLDSMPQRALSLRATQVVQWFPRRRRPLELSCRLGDEIFQLLH